MLIKTKAMIRAEGRKSILMITKESRLQRRIEFMGKLEYEWGHIISVEGDKIKILWNYNPYDYEKENN